MASSLYLRPRTFGLRMLAVKNSTQRRPAWRPRAAITAGTVAPGAVRIVAGGCLTLTGWTSNQGALRRVDPALAAHSSSESAARHQQGLTNAMEGPNHAGEGYCQAKA